MENAGKILIALLGFAGFLLARYIRTHKQRMTPLVCPLEGSCESVVHSDYSRIFGIPVELLGMIYYALIAILYSLSVLYPVLISTEISYIVLSVSIVAFLFSMYLTAGQAFVLHHWCTWCLFSASICTAIFLLALIVMNQNILNVFIN